MQLRTAEGVKTRILAITNMYPPHHLGGYELACRDAVVRWRSHGHDVSVLTSDIRFPHAEGSPDEDGVRRELELYWRDNVTISPPLRERLRIERRNLSVLRSALDDVRPDVVSLWHMGATSMGMLTEITRRGIPMVLVVYDQWPVYGPEVDAWMRIFTKRRWVAGPAARATGMHTRIDISDDAAVVYMSDWLKQRCEQLSTLGLPRHRAVVHGGIDRSRFSPGPRRPSFSWKLLVAGRVEERKGVHVAIEALASLPMEAALDVVGSWDDEAYVARLRTRCDELGLGERVRWHGQTSREQLTRFFQDADAFLFPVVWDEPFGMVPLEAMACGTPVIGTGTGGSAEFLLDGINSLRVPPGDAAALAAAVERLATDNALRDRIVRAGTLTSSHFGDDRYIDELEAWHVAASERFANGEPAGRAPLADLLSSLPREND